MIFPKKETEMVYLAVRMINGYFAHTLDFPSVNRMTLYFRYRDYNDARTALFNKKTKAHLAAVRKERRFTELCEIMKKDLRLSEVDTRNNPEKLSFIGWGVKSNPLPAEIPAQPINLRIGTIKETAVQLKWDRPLRGIVRNYIIQRRQKQTSGNFSQWLLIAASYKTQITLSNQPKGINLEYRVKAVNTAGQSQSSNTVSNIL